MEKQTALKKIYQQFLMIEKNRVHHLTQYLNGNADEPLNEDDTISFTVPFAGGYEMDIKVCGTDTDAAFSEAVLFDANGSQVAYTDPGEDLVGEWSLEHDGITYTVIVVPGDKAEERHFAMATVFGPNGKEPLSPNELSKHANAVHRIAGGKGNPFTPNDFYGLNEKCRLRGEGHCYCGTIDGKPNGVSAGKFELLPLSDPDVRSGGKAYMFCRTCGGFSHL